MGKKKMKDISNRQKPIVKPRESWQKYQIGQKKIDWQRHNVKKVLPPSKRKTPA
ncbi:MAG: hypothetical protein HYR76_03860 [Ignavibacteria bacterium]|nr:hypothetical protein [Ignavibacteria bacterium]MBI3765136.1 hypothetical protein [Ignavibacteriales bacterium]